MEVINEQLAEVAPNLYRSEWKWRLPVIFVAFQAGTSSPMMYPAISAAKKDQAMET